jgi:hypothetical protein
MTVMLQYRLSDGWVQGTWESSTLANLQAQIVPDDPAYGYLATDIEITQQVLLAAYYVPDGVLTAKIVLTLTATPSPFVADGIAVCTVTVSPFVPCTLLVDGSEAALTAADPMLELTSNVPHVFHVELAPVAAYRADPVTVEAT